MQLLELEAIVNFIHGSTFGDREEGPGESVKSCDPELLKALHLLEKAASVAKYGGRVWPEIWLRVPRESWEEIEAEVEEGDEYSREDFEGEHPHEIHWMAVTIRCEADGGWVLCHSKPECAFQFAAKSHRARGFRIRDREGKKALIQYVRWLGTALREELQRWAKDVDAYNRWLESDIPNRHRLGKMRRECLWRALPDEQHLVRDEISPAEVRRFVDLVARLQSDAAPDNPGPKWTRDEFLRICALCYAGARYEGSSKLAPLALYRKFADGRHDGLLDLPGKSSAAFEKWLEGGSRGGHPWEIARGGNSTHISLYVHRRGHNPRLHLAGTAATRAAETIRMALALGREGIPFELADAAHLARLAQGQDWIGVVPDDQSASYAQDLFPKSDEVVHVVPHWSLSDTPAVEACIQWYPVRVLQRCKPNSRESAKRLAALGGSEKSLRPAPRRRARRTT